MDKYKNYRIIIWWYANWSNDTYMWIQHWFHKAFKYLWYNVTWVDNKIENLPNKNENVIFFAEHREDSFLMENLSINWIIFNHDYNLKQSEKIIPFWVKALSFASYPPISTDEYRNYLKIPKIFWATDLVPNEIEFKPYHYSNSKDVTFIGSWWFDNWKALETARIWCLLNWKNFQQQWRHIFLRYKKFISEDEIAKISQEAYMALSIQWKPQCNTGYVPCRILKNMSYSVLGISNNLFLANLFDDDEIIIDRNISNLLDKAEKVVKDKSNCSLNL